MTYHNSIILESERLQFRAHVPADKDVYCAMEMDALVRRYVGGHPRTREDAEGRFMNALKPVSGKLNMWATVFKQDDKYIGRCGIYPHFAGDGSVIPGEASLGLYIAREYWGRGLATEAGEALINMGFDELKLNWVVTMVQVGNEASVRVLQKLGSVIEWTENNPNGRSFYHFELKNPRE